MKSIYVCAIGAKYAAMPYMNKLVGVLNSMHIAPIYLCWQRGEEDAFVAEHELICNVLFKKEAKGRIGLLLGYFLWMWRIFLFAAKDANKGSLFFASRIDAGLPIFLASMLFGHKYIYLDRDAAFMSYRLPSFLRNALKGVESLVARNSLRHIIPGESRNYTGGNNVRVVRNSPSTVELAVAKRISDSQFRRDSRFTVYVNGWLTSTRGMGFIRDALISLPVDKFRFVIAGRLACDEAKEIAALENSEYLGVLNNSTALSVYYISDVVLSFYDPRIEINRRAEPNKWLDCLFTGTPFIVNKGVETAMPFLEMGVCKVIDYGDSKALEELLLLLGSRESEIRSSDFFAPQGYAPWDTAMRDCLVEVI